MGETIIIFSMQSEITKICADIDLAKLYNAQGSERTGQEKVRLCLLPDTENFTLPDSQALEDNIYYVQHAGQDKPIRQRQIEQLGCSTIAASKLRYYGTFSHIPGDTIWDYIRVICSPNETSDKKQASLAALTDHVKQSHLCRSLDDLVALVWLFEMSGEQHTQAKIQVEIGNISFAGGDELKRIASNEGFKKMRLKAEAMWLEAKGGGSV